MYLALATLAAAAAAAADAVALQGLGGGARQNAAPRLLHLECCVVCIPGTTYLGTPSTS